MRKLLLAVALACSGCATINRANDYHGMGIEDGDTVSIYDFEFDYER